MLQGGFGLIPDPSQNGKDSDQPGLALHSFIVKIWVETVPEGTETVRWHGHITHVLSNTRKYLQKLGDIAGFIKPYVAGMEAKSGLMGRVKQWLRH